MNVSAHHQQQIQHATHHYAKVQETTRPTTSRGLGQVHGLCHKVTSLINVLGIGEETTPQTHDMVGSEWMWKSARFVSLVHLTILFKEEDKAFLLLLPHALGKKHKTVLPTVLENM